MTANVLSIAGSDPSGGAGIQADLKTFAALGTYGMAAITALTAQNTRGVSGVHAVPPAFVAEQVDMLFADIRVDAVKVGMLGGAAVVAAVADRLRRHRPESIVVDPVMVAKSGDRLLDEAAVETLRGQLLPLATILTPNLPEAGVLLDRAPPADPEAMRRAAIDLHAIGPRYVLLKGGHLAGICSDDLLFDGSVFLDLPARRVPTKNTHGTGCTLSAALAALLPQSPDVAHAARAAKSYITAAIAASDRLTVGQGYGPIHHFHAVWHGGARL
jgi:hydroxymethylpyrimidine/phosphomethylpyrimidine kinase